jgi:diguanylate cyclase (GGDEF)-like protein/PAS domain S-box-containing protein
MDVLGTIELCNSAVKSIFGYEPEQLTGKNIKLLIPTGLGKKYERFFNQAATSATDTPFSLNLETRGERRDGSEFPLEITISESHIGSKSIYIGIMRDISAYKSLINTLNQKNHDLEHLSTHDALTNLYNRRYADQYLQREHKRACRNSSNLAVILIDVDYFKKFNDLYGHQAGDECLKHTTSAMRQCLKRPSDIIARYGGEEFLVILPDTPRDGAILVAEQLLDSVRKLAVAHSASTASNVVTISAGITVLFPDINCSYDKLIAAADQALYTAKQAGRNRYHYSDITSDTQKP